MKNKKLLLPACYIENLISNIFFLLSFTCFMLMNIRFSVTGKISFAVAIICATVLVSYIPDIKKSLLSTPKPICLFAAVSGIGILIYTRQSFLQGFEANVARALNIFSLILALFSMLFIYTALVGFYKYLSSLWTPFWGKLQRYEYLIYGVLVLLMSLLVIYSFSTSNAFYGSKNKYDIIYTSDSSLIMRFNSFMNIHADDIRHPLFSVFSAPFTGFAYLLSIPFSKILPYSYELFVQLAQVLLLLIATLLVAQAINLSSFYRIIFVMICFTSYPYLLFSLIIERYIISYFWLSLAFYTFVKGKKCLPLIGAGGTVLTSIVFAPLCAWFDSKSVAGIKEKTIRIIKYLFRISVLFLIILMLFGHFDVIIDIPQLQQLSLWTGASGSERLFQYVAFPIYCFFAPSAGGFEHFLNPFGSSDDYPSWQLNQPNTVNLFGVLILLIAAIGIFVNRKDKSIIFAGYWILFSISLMMFFGWGSDENGMILYSLYFSWAFIVVIFKLIERIAVKIKIKFLLPIMCMVLIVLQVVVNFRSINELICFAQLYYPI